MEAFANSIGLRGAGLGAGMFDATARQEELVILNFWAAAKLRASVGQHSNDAHFICFETKNLVIQHFSSRHGRLGKAAQRSTRMAAEAFFAAVAANGSSRSSACLSEGDKAE